VFQLMLGGQQIYNAEKKLLHELEFADAGILCEVGDAERMWLLMSQGVPLTLQAPDGATLLQKATHSRSIAILTLLLDAKVSVNAKGAFGYTPLHEAAFLGDPAVVEHLLKYGANPDAISRNGSTALLVAAREGHAGAVKALLAGRAHADDGGARGETPLKIAEMQGHHEVCSVLVAYEGTRGTMMPAMPDTVGEVHMEPRMLPGDLQGPLDAAPAFHIGRASADASSPLEGKPAENAVEVAVMLDSP
jgi:hypothetical protein